MNIVSLRFFLQSRVTQRSVADLLNKIFFSNLKLRRSWYAYNAENCLLLDNEIMA